ncbi:hypothetical protein J6590_088022 [Homalodisca vitripennis]|nr:hypothetical protein J6590_088022 [Homalodisca vitripennis]
MRRYNSYLASVEFSSSSPSSYMQHLKSQAVADLTVVVWSLFVQMAQNIVGDEELRSSKRNPIIVSASETPRLKKKCNLDEETLR